MSSHRALEVLFGVATLVSVVSVPIPRRAQPDPILTARARIDTARVEELKRVSDVQRADVARLARETRELSLMLRTPYSARDGGTVRVPDARVLEPENEEHECSQ
jgi:hypothetical protein